MPRTLYLDQDKQGRFVVRAMSGQYFFGYAVELVFPDLDHTIAFMTNHQYVRSYPGRAGVPHTICGDWHCNEQNDITSV